MPRSSTLSLRKVIFEARYKPHLGFYDLLLPAAEQFAEYPDWWTDRASVLLRDVERHCSLGIRNDRFVYEQDSGVAEVERERIASAIERLLPSLRIDSFLRLGYRRKYLLEVKMSFSALVDVVRTKLFSDDERLSRILPAQAENLAYTLDSRDDEEGRYHIRAAPVSGSDAAGYIGLSEKHFHPESVQLVLLDFLRTDPAVALYFDVDYFVSNEVRPLPHPGPFVDKAREKIQRLVEELGDYLLSTDIKE